MIRGPLVSIGLPTRNRAHLLKNALISLTGQTYRNIELIISDNASTDDTEQVVQRFAARDERIAYTRQKRDINGMENHEFVLRRAHGAYFMWASDDDLWDKTFVEKLVCVLEKNPEYGVAMSHYYKKTIYDGADRTETMTHDFTRLSHQELYTRYLRGRIVPIFFFGLYRRELLNKIFRRKTPSGLNGLNLTLGEIALATRCYSLPEILHTQLQDARPYTVRHPTNPYTIGILDPFAVNRYVFKIPWWLMTSAAIPFWRKRLILVPWLKRAWQYKRKAAHEWARFLKYLLYPLVSLDADAGKLLATWLSSGNYRELGEALFVLKKMARHDRKSIDALISIRRDELSHAGEIDNIAKLDFLEARLT
ncbi:MAG: glycosyltransferase [Candidatus Vogelbacteria bacterium]|nr:glycosyltransferase [Candidatus Vogelbacteria bacterium]